MSGFLGEYVCFNNFRTLPKAGGFVKAVFLLVDASVWINNVFGKQGSGGIIRRDENNA
jgi:hypothetical protein